MWVLLLRWPLRDGVGNGFVRENVTVHEAVLEDGTESELGSSAEFVFGVGAGRPPAFWVSELLEVAVLMVLEGPGVVQPLLL